MTGWGRYWLARPLHPVAWWIWALGVAVAASRTTNPVVLATIVAVVSWVVVARRADAPWARAYRFYLIGGAVIVVLRIVFRVLFGGGGGGFVLVPLPSVPLPSWVAGVRLLGDVTAAQVLGGLYDGLRLATMLVCLGAANALANPRRLLRSLPPALSEVSTAVVVALSVFPQLAESVLRVRRARRLRARPPARRLASLRSVVVPVLEDALDRSMLLAASMDARGHGRRSGRSHRRIVVNGVAMVAGLAGVCVGVYGTFDTTTPRYLGLPTLGLGVAVGIAGIAMSGRTVVRSAYQPDSWRLAECLTIASGVGAGVVGWLAATLDPALVAPSIEPLGWPQPSTVAMAGVLLALLPAFATPLPEEPTRPVPEPEAPTPIGRAPAGVAT